MNQLAAIVFAGTAAWMLALASPEEPGATLSKVAYIGSGCGAGTVSSLLSPDGRALTLLFSDYSAAENQRRGCDIDLELSYSPGFSFGLFRSDFRGYAKVARGAAAFQDVGLRIGGGTYRLFATQSLRGEYDNDYFFRYILGGQQVVYSACPASKQKLKLRTSIKTVGLATMTVDSMDGVAEQRYGFAWKRCGAGSADTDTIPLFRAYNIKADSHFYTSNPREYEAVVAAGYRGEGVAVLVSKSASHPSQSAIHRLYNPNNGRHYYTTNTAEKNALVNLGWRYEKDEGYLFVTQVVGTETVNRLYNRKTGGHLFTANQDETDYLLSYAGTPWELHSPLGYGLIEIGD